MSTFESETKIASPKHSHVVGNRVNTPPPRPHHRRNKFLFWLLILGLLGAITGVWWKYHHNVEPTAGQRGGGGRRAFGNMIMPVKAETAQKGSVNVYLNALGTITPLATVTVRPQVSGLLTEIRFTEGQMVQKGDVLAVIDPRPFEASLAQSEAQLAQSEALLKSSQADLERYETLVKQDSISSQQVDAARFLVQQHEGAVKGDQAAIATAKLNLAYCRITSPISGRVGLRLVDAGNYVSIGDATGVALITQLHPITAVFSLPEDQIPAVSKEMKSGRSIVVEAYDRGQVNKLATGKLSTIDNKVDTSTGTFKLKAEFANEEDTLFPNQFVNIRLLLRTVSDAVVISASGIERGVDGTYVYLIQDDDTVKAQPVVLGPSENDRVVVTSGLVVGQRVVVDGADRLKEGAKVSVPADNAGAGKPAGNGGAMAPGGAGSRREGGSGGTGGHRREGGGRPGGGNRPPADGNGGTPPATKP
jgi:multidrug efflux system membrane fusion protein